jgi:hypothetical protein
LNSLGRSCATEIGRVVTTFAEQVSSFEHTNDCLLAQLGCCGELHTAIFNVEDRITAFPCEKMICLLWNKTIFRSGLTVVRNLSISEGLEVWRRILHLPWPAHHTPTGDSEEPRPRHGRIPSIFSTLGSVRDSRVDGVTFRHNGSFDLFIRLALRCRTILASSAQRLLSLATSRHSRPSREAKGRVMPLQ